MKIEDATAEAGALRFSRRYACGHMGGRAEALMLRFSGWRDMDRGHAAKPRKMTETAARMFAAGGMQEQKTGRPSMRQHTDGPACCRPV